MTEQHEQGMVSIMVTLILMIVLSLIVLGFAQISRRNARQVLDNQLSTQAFYAAETGVNDVHKLIQTAIQNGQPVPAKPDCTSGSGSELAFYGTQPPLAPTVLKPVINAANNVAYTCILVNPTPSSLVYSDIGTTGTVVPMIASSGIVKLTLTWNSKILVGNPTIGCPVSVSGSFSDTASWACGYGVLRFDLVPTVGSLTAASLQSSTMTTFAVPFRIGGTNSVGYSTTGAADDVGVACTSTSCKLSITGLGATEYYMRVTSQYKDVSLQIDAFDALGNPLPLQGAQAVIDATGKAEDVLRRIQVHVPLLPSSQNQTSDYALESTSAVCKRFDAMTGLFQSDADNAVSGVGASGNPLCQ